MAHFVGRAPQSTRCQRVALPLCRTEEASQEPGLLWPERHDAKGMEVCGHLPRPGLQMVVQEDDVQRRSGPVCSNVGEWQELRHRDPHSPQLIQGMEDVTKRMVFWQRQYSFGGQHKTHVHRHRRCHDSPVPRSALGARLDRRLEAEHGSQWFARRKWYGQQCTGHACKKLNIELVIDFGDRSYGTPCANRGHGRP